MFWKTIWKIYETTKTQWDVLGSAVLKKWAWSSGGLQIHFFKRFLATKKNCNIVLYGILSSSRKECDACIAVHTYILEEGLTGSLSTHIVHHVADCIRKSVCISHSFPAVEHQPMLKWHHCLYTYPLISLSASCSIPFKYFPERQHNSLANKSHSSGFHFHGFHTGVCARRLR